MSLKYVGKLEPTIATYWDIKNHSNKPILVYEDRIEHVISSHINDFSSKEEILKIYGKLHIIINKPDYVFYNKNNNGLEYYKKLSDNVCVAVRVNNGNVLKVKSWYPVTKTKIKNRKLKDSKYICENLFKQKD